MVPLASQAHLAVKLKPGASGSQRPSPSQTNLTVQAVGHASGARSRLCGHAHWLLSAFCRQQPQVQPPCYPQTSSRALEARTRPVCTVEKGAEVNRHCTSNIAINNYFYISFRSYIYAARVHIAPTRRGAERSAPPIVEATVLPTGAEL